MKRSSPTTPPPTTPDPDPSPPEPPTNTPKRLKPDPDTGSNTKTKTRTRIPSTPATPHSAVPGLSAENKMALIDELIGEGMKHVDLQTWADRLGLKKSQISDQLKPNRANLRKKVVQAAGGSEGK